MNALDEDRAIQVLAEAANADPKYRANLRILLEYLEVAGLIVREGTQIRANRNLPISGQSEEDAMPTPSEHPSEPAVVAGPMSAAVGVATSFNHSPAAGVIQFQIDVRVDLKEMSGWRPDRIAAFFSGIAQVVTAKGTLEKNVSGDS